jgi:hypothetical protein
MARRIVVLEQSDALEISRAATALSECASVLIYSSQEQLAEDLKIAA